MQISDPHHRSGQLTIFVLNDDLHKDSLEITHLQEQGYIVNSFPIAYSLSTPQNYPDLFIINIASPKSDVFALVERIRAQSAQVGILLVISLENQDDRVRAFLSGADNYIVRPYEIEELLATVGSLARRLQGCGVVLCEG
jgi:DNA-binding response OmpR family regulator